MQSVRKIVENLFEEYKDEIGDATPDQWLEHAGNVCYEYEGSVALFTHEYPGVYSGHWFFKARGRAALNLARHFIDRLFHETSAKVIRGLTPVEKKHASWAARQVGFQSLGFVNIHNKDYELFYLNKKDFT